MRVSCVEIEAIQIKSVPSLREATLATKDNIEDACAEYSRQKKYKHGTA